MRAHIEARRMWRARVLLTEIKSKHTQRREVDQRLLVISVVE